MRHISPREASRQPHHVAEWERGVECGYIPQSSPADFVRAAEKKRDRLECHRLSDELNYPVELVEVSIAQQGVRKTLCLLEKALDKHKQDLRTEKRRRTGKRR